MTKFNLLETVELRGVWWLPGAPDQRVPGVLRFEPATGLHLQLEGALEENGYAIPKGPPIILGLTGGGTPITVNRTSHAGRSTSHTATESIHLDRYWAGTAYIGAHFAAEPEPLFLSCTFGLSGLVEWLRKPAFTVQSPLDLGASAFHVELHYETLCEAPVPGSATTVTLLNSVTGSEQHGRHFTLTAAPYFRLTSSVPTSFHRFQALVQVLRILLSILQHRADAVTWIQVSAGADTASEIDVILNATPPTPLPEKSSFRMFLPFWRVSNELPTLIARWCETEPAFGDLRFEYYRTQLASEPRMALADVLTLTQLLEAFHRRSSTEVLLPPERFVEQAACVRALLPRQEAPELSDRVAEWLRHANDLTLRKRLKRLLTALPAQVTSRITKSPEDFIDIVVEARNLLTHNPPSSGPTDTLKDPVGMALRLRGLFLAHLILSCGVTGDAVTSGFKEEADFQWMPGGFTRDLL